ncbi:unnamed protein product, partial [Phaeothamnion confervicola]
MGNGALSGLVVAAGAGCGAPRGQMRVSICKMVKVVGVYCRPQIAVEQRVVDLGKLGHSASDLGRRAFPLRVRNACQAALSIGIEVGGGASGILQLEGWRPAAAAATDWWQQVGAGSCGAAAGIAVPAKAVPPTAAMQAAVATLVAAGSTGGGHGDTSVNDSRNGGGINGGGCPPAAPDGAPSNGAAYGAMRGPIPIAARGEVTLLLVLRLPAEGDWSGMHTVPLRVVNLADPSDAVPVEIRVQVVTRLLQLLDRSHEPLPVPPPPPPLAALLAMPLVRAEELKKPQAAAAAAGEAASAGRKPAAGETGAAAAAAVAGAQVAGALVLAGDDGLCRPVGAMLQLPSLTVPAEAGGPSSAALDGEASTTMLALKNVFDEAVTVLLSLQIPPQLRETVAVVLRMRPSYAPVSTLTLVPGEVVEMRVECCALPGARLRADLLPAPDEAAANVGGGGSWRCRLATLSLRMSIHDAASGGKRYGAGGVPGVTPSASAVV